MISDFIGPTVSVQPPGVDESVWHCQGCSCGGQLGRLIEADTKTEYESKIWYSDGETEEFTHHSRDRETLRQSVIDSAGKHIGESDGVATVVRSEARCFEVHTYRVNEQVLGRFGEWDEVADADS